MKRIAAPMVADGEQHDPDLVVIPAVFIVAERAEI
jgi:hypothetical protein